MIASDNMTTLFSFGYLIESMGDPNDASMLYSRDTTGSILSLSRSVTTMDRHSKSDLD